MGIRSAETNREVHPVLQWGGRLVGSFFFGIFLVFGLFFLMVMSRELVRSGQTYWWPTAEAVVERSWVANTLDEEDPYVPEVEYRYLWDGQWRESKQLSLQKGSFSTYDGAAGRLEGFAEGQVTRCYVNPTRTEEAILVRGDLWIAPFLLIPLIFVGVGVVGIVSAWWPGRAKASGAPVKNSVVVQRAVGGIFTLIGAAVLVFWFLPTATRAWHSLGWIATPCEVLSSRVSESRDSDGTTYGVDILYRYVFDGREYRSSRYRVMNVSSSGYSGKEEIIRQYPAGKQVTCYVNPKRPSEAVLMRGGGLELLFGIVPLVFMGIGLYCVFAKVPGSGAVEAFVTGDPTGVALKSKSTPTQRLAGILFASVFWNGIVAVFISQVIEGFNRARPDWFLVFFLVPFVVIGLLIIWGAVMALAALANPKFELVLQGVAPRVGGEMTVTWVGRGALSRLRRLRIFVEAAEEATYQRGTTTTTDRHVFLRLPLVELNSWMEMGQGDARLQLPAAAMPSFSAPCNKIVWSLRLHGEIGLWPDVRETYDVPVALGRDR